MEKHALAFLYASAIICEFENYIEEQKYASSSRKMFDVHVETFR